MNKKVMRKGLDTIIRVSELGCHCCGAIIQNPIDFSPGEPLVSLCQKCVVDAMRDDFGPSAKTLVSELSEAKPVKFLASESMPGQSSGKERKTMSMGDAENANGCWDNMIREMEQD